MSPCTDGKFRYVYDTVNCYQELQPGCKLALTLCQPGYIDVHACCVTLQHGAFVQQTCKTNGMATDLHAVLHCSTCHPPHTGVQRELLIIVCTSEDRKS